MDKNFNKPHPTFTLFHNGVPVRIDEEISELISLMWNLGINTYFCCQGKSRQNKRNSFNNKVYRAYIMFENDDVGFNFVKEMLMSYPPFLKRTKKLIDFEFDHRPPFGHRITIRFPNREIPTMVKWIKETF